MTTFARRFGRHRRVRVVVDCLACLMLAGVMWLPGTAGAAATPSPQQRNEGGAQPAERTIRLTSSPAAIHMADGTYSVALDGVHFSRPRPVSDVVRLRYAEFNPLDAGPGAGEPTIGDPRLRLDGADEGEHIYVVQFIVPPIEAFLNELRGEGATPLIFLADQCFIVRMTAAQRDAVAQRPYVRWIGMYQPAYRLEESLRAALAFGQSIPAQRYSIQLFERGPAPQETLSQRIIALGGIVTARKPLGFRIEATLNEMQLLEVSRMNDVLFIDPRGEPGEDMDVARQIGGAVPVLDKAGFRGEGVRGEVMDGGVRTTHVALQNPPILLHGPNGFSFGHGTNTTGCVFGDGTGNAAGTGMLPAREQIIFASYSQLDDRYAHTAELVDPQGLYRAVFQSNSWGDSLTTQYTTISAEMDDILFINDILICQSQSNAGDQDSRPQAWAKNIVSVGGIRHENTLTRTDDHWTTASVGPATDGRIKPDLAHFYDNVTCTASSSSNNAAYTNSFSGTSAATPIVAGHFGLLFQMWHEQVFPGFGGQSTVFDSRPHMTTAKALMVNTAFRYNWLSGGPNGSLTRVRQGWGMPDIARLYAAGDQLFIVNESVALAPFASQSYQIAVPSGQGEFRATMTYRDPPGNTSSSVHRINDLSLRVTSPGGTQYWGNNGLLSSNVSTAGGSSNTIDTVENVFVLNPESGLWTVEVIADEVVQDAHVATPELDATFALVVTGSLAEPQIGGDADGDGDVDVDDLIAVILGWGPCPAPPEPCPADVAPAPNGDGEVDVNDLIEVILNWG